MFIQYIIIFFALFAVYRAILRLKDKTISKREFALWSGFWVVVIIATLIPKNLDILAQIAGVGRGVDLAIYLSIVVIFYLLFRVFARLDRIDKNITQLVRHLALNNNKENNEKSRNSLGEL